MGFLSEMSDGGRRAVGDVVECEGLGEAVWKLPKGTLGLWVEVVIRMAGELMKGSVGSIIVKCWYLAFSEACSFSC